MIVLHNLRGEEFALNAELIERVEGDSETHVTLVTGTSYVVREPEAEVIHLWRMDRAEIQMLAGQLLPELSIPAPAPNPSLLHLVEPTDSTERRERP
jgi:uncharacterized protein YlzI (FlbEa/FlbD family)